MKTFIKLITLGIALLISCLLSAQDFQGVATYKTKRKVDIKLDSTQANNDMQKQIMEMLKKQFEKTFTLTFDQNESIYKEEESLSAPQVGGSNGLMVMTAGGGSDILYKNTKEQRFVNQNELMGKVFLVKDSIPKREWKLESDTKNIGEYTCYKATITREIEVRKSGISFNDNKETDEVETEMQTQIITAWYTPQIPVSNGPQKYQGLPGLILEVNDGEETIICSKIVINPEDRISIKEPNKGKEVDQEEFDVIREKKLKELQERYAPRNGRDGESIQIRIGG
ncbi:MAG: GLPGLI family protein [Psychroserpens sp.]|nr:GLPGLI family protein [Psychroserpens sp.]